MSSHWPFLYEYVLSRQAPRGYGHAFFSALSGGTHISAHHGPTNKKLRVFLPLVLQPKQAYLTVNHTEIELEEGRAVVFDDSFLHSSRNILSGVPRIALIFDIWHPDLTDEEVS
ncbi:aspartyl/asparaginyl beta-hydroxylase domain-containing protein [archaeon]|nr:MAG: aspartyl/asparaginyl beta-hydroxylase domain-containing protein [archaeon]